MTIRQFKTSWHLWLQIWPAANIIHCLTPTVAIPITLSMYCSSAFKHILRPRLDFLLFPIMETTVVPSPATAPPQCYWFPTLILPIHHSSYISLTHPVNCPSPLWFVATDLRFTMRILRSIFRLTITALSYTALRLCAKRPVSCVSTAKSYSSSAKLILCKLFNSCWGESSRAVPAHARPQDSWIICSSRLSALSIFLTQTFFHMQMKPLLILFYYTQAYTHTTCLTLYKTKVFVWRNDAN